MSEVKSPLTPALSPRGEGVGRALCRSVPSLRSGDGARRALPISSVPSPQRGEGQGEGGFFWSARSFT